MATTVLHVFQEEKQEDRDSHLAHWFGHPLSELPDEDGSWPVCFCGGRMYPMNKTENVTLVWHRREWRSKK
jgi:hypothetical protein